MKPKKDYHSSKKRIMPASLIAQTIIINRNPLLE
jgi:hypothetical protein